MGGLIKGTGAGAGYGCSVGMTAPAAKIRILTGATGSYIFRHGDYDYVNGSIADWTSGYSQTLPNSFYLPQPALLLWRVRGELHLPVALGHANRIEPDPVAGRDRMHR